MKTKIEMHFGDKIIYGTLNESTAAKEFIKRLPCTISASRAEFDICGTMKKPLPWIKDELVTGWHNGDISFDGTYFAILFGHEEESASYGLYANLGVIDCPLSEMETLHGHYDILVKAVNN